MRIAPHPLPRLTAAALALFVLAGCADRTPFTPPTPEPPAPAPARALGVVEITLSGLAEGATPSASVLSARSASELAVLRATAAAAGGRGTSFALTPPTLGSGSQDGSIQLEPLASGSFTQGTRGKGGVRYLWATYRVRNAQADGTAYSSPRQNLSFVAVATGSTLAQTAVSRLRRFDGSNATPAIATTMTPTGAVQKNPATGAIASASPDVLQLFSESEAAAMPRSGATDVFPYGFVVRNAATGSRTLPADPGAEQWDGIVTFAFQLPLQATAAEDPFSISILFQALDDSDTRISESLEEQTFGGGAAFAARATALGAGVTLLPGSGYAGGQTTRTLCGVRTAGSSASPTHTLAPCPEEPLVKIRPETITAGANHSCGLTTGGIAYCWGRNDFGQLGDGTRGYGINRNTPVAVSSGLRFTSISAGGIHTVALTADGTAYAWGYNGAGGLGDGTTTDRSTPVAVKATPRFTSISAGDMHTVALTADGTAYAWGYNVAGGLGDGTTTDRSTPVAVSTTHRFTSTSAGGYHTVALIADGTAFAWGGNGVGQLGDGTTTQRNTPVAVTTTQRFASIRAGGQHTVALTADGTAFAWGGNGVGQLGDGTNTNRTAPVAVSGGLKFVSINADAQHTVALTADGTAYAWGYNGNGGLGDGTTTGRSAPVAVSTTQRFKSISAGTSHTVALTGGGIAYVWGLNGDGQLGDGSYDDRTTPVAVSGGLTFLLP